MLDREVVHVDTEPDVETKENHFSDHVTTSSSSSSGDGAPGKRYGRIKG